MLQVEPNLQCASPEHIDSVWWQVAPLIKRALDRGSIYTLNEIRLGLKSCEMQLWCWVEDEIRACLVTSIQEDDKSRFCLLLALGGEKMDLWMKHLPLVEDWARENGCSEMRIYGRIGWAKVTGYNIDYTKMSKEL